MKNTHNNMKNYLFLLIFALFQSCSTGEKAFTDPFEAQMVAIPSGSFEMGCTEADGKCQDKEMPVHTVKIAAFQLSKFEVTRIQWQKVMGTPSPSYFKNCDDCPVEWANRQQIAAFLLKMKEKTGKSYRLPTEAEWEYAARAGEKTRYSGGENLAELAWYKVNSSGKTQPVGKKKANKWGLYDMSGNVSEWCLDYYEKEFYAKSEAENPCNKTVSDFYIMRGGSWMSGDGTCRSVWRGWVSGQSNNYDVGFRVAL